MAELEKQGQLLRRVLPLIPSPLICSPLIRSLQQRLQLSLRLREAPCGLVRGSELAPELGGLLGDAGVGRLRLCHLRGAEGGGGGLRSRVRPVERTSRAHCRLRIAC